jgi:hypothetical protein
VPKAIFQIGMQRLALCDSFGFKSAITVTMDVDFQWARGSLQGFLAVAVTAIFRALGVLFVRWVPEMVFLLTFEHRLKGKLEDVLDGTLGTCDVLDRSGYFELFQDLGNVDGTDVGRGNVTAHLCSFSGRRRQV